MRIIAIVNQKGGVGKTTTAINLSAGLAMMNREVLLVDLDPQANATIGLGSSALLDRPSMYDVMSSPDEPVEAVIENSRVRGLSLAPANLNLASTEVTLVNRRGREAVLRDKLGGLERRFQYCLIDCPPSLGLLTVNALMAAKELLIPIQMGYFALEGVRQLAVIVELVREQLGHKALAITGVLCTFYDGRTRLSREAVEKVRDYFGEKVFDSVVRRNVALDEAASHHQTIYEYAPRSRAARAYRDLVMEVIEREPRSGHGSAQE